MYRWLYEACERSAVVVTAGRRLARQLTAEYQVYRRDAGDRAWRTPNIRAIGDWLGDRFEMADPESLPTRLSTSQARLLWEQALRDEIHDPLINVGSVVRPALEAWQRLNDWQVPFEEFTASATGRDQRLFARAAQRYLARLESSGWIDPAMLGAFILGQMPTGAGLPDEILFAGFDRRTPLLDGIVRTARERGCRVEFEPGGPGGRAGVQRFENAESELRAAGAWARRLLSVNPGARIAIVVTDLERQASRAARLLREGLVPGWQYANPQVGAALNVSYGRPLAEYAAIQVALLALRWCHDSLSGREISVLLRSPFLGTAEVAERTRLELELRRLPDRAWTPALFLRAFDGRPRGTDAADWLSRLSRVVDTCAAQPRGAAPSRWAEAIDGLLGQMGWPGTTSLDSVDFQLVDRWRVLLNELAALGLVESTVSFADAVAQVSTMARDTLFQPERHGAVAQLLGPLEASGLRFDSLWVSGCTADAWPPAGRPLALLSRALQQRFGMPDGDPADTTEYAERVLSRLRNSAAEVVFSYAAVTDETEQTVSPMLDAIPQVPADSDPGWYARRLQQAHRNVLVVRPDRVPPVAAGEPIAGGAATIGLQLSEPFAAFASGRLGIQRLRPFMPGVSALVRGTLLHAGLYRLYEQRPSQSTIRGWDKAELDARVADAIEQAFRSQARSADPVLRELLELERLRSAQLLREVVDSDLDREPFTIASVEHAADIVVSGVPLRVRPDRIDRYDDGSVAILDYKTGQSQSFLRPRDDDPGDLQPVVYAAAVDAEIAELGFYNIARREVSISSASRVVAGEDAWPDTLSRWQSLVATAAADLARGDVRVNGQQGIREARALALLTRIAELWRDA